MEEWQLGGIFWHLSLGIILVFCSGTVFYGVQSRQVLAAVRTALPAVGEFHLHAAANIHQPFSLRDALRQGWIFHLALWRKTWRSDVSSNLPRISHHRRREQRLKGKVEERQLQPCHAEATPYGCSSATGWGSSISISISTSIPTNINPFSPQLSRRDIPGLSSK